MLVDGAVEVGTLLWLMILCLEYVQVAGPKVMYETLTVKMAILFLPKEKDVCMIFSLIGGLGQVRFSSVGVHILERL